MGYQAGYTAGTNNTCIGYAAYPAGGATNYMALGYFSGGNWSSASNTIELGNGSVSKIWAAINTITISDKRIKNNIREDVPGLSFINLLHPVTYNVDLHKEESFSKRKNTGDWEGKYDIEKIRMTGFLAQDVYTAAKSIGYDFSGVEVPKDGELYGLKYSEFVVPLVKAVQEQQLIITTQQKTIDDLLKRVEKLEHK